MENTFTTKKKKSVSDEKKKSLKQNNKTNGQTFAASTAAHPLSGGFKSQQCQQLLTGPPLEYCSKGPHQKKLHKKVN